MMLAVLTAAEAASKPMTPGAAIFLILCLVAFTGLMVWAMMRNRRLDKRNQAGATQRGWTFTPQDDSLRTRYRTWPFTVEPQTSHIRRIMTTGVRGHGTTLFDYEVRFGVGSGTTINGIPIPSGPHVPEPTPSIFDGVDLTFDTLTGPNQSARQVWRSDKRTMMTYGVCVMEMPGPLPQILVKHRVGGERAISQVMSLGQVDVDLTQDKATGDDKFSRLFDVKEEVPGVANQLIGTRARQALLTEYEGVTAHVFHLWTWDRYLFAMDTRVLGFKWVDGRLNLLADIIDDAPASLWNR